jgi:uncharacterized lipoprotein YddW (UPF0748 family)
MQHGEKMKAPVNRFASFLLTSLIAVCSMAQCVCLAAESLTIDAFDYPTTSAARASWIPSSTSPQVGIAEQGEWGSEPVMLLPCPFTNPVTRCYWDRSVSLDLTGYREISLRLYVPNPAPISWFTLYFHSVSGWYGKSAGITGSGWQHFQFSRSDFGEEDTPAGWDQIDRIRLSPWKAADIDTYLAMDELAAFNPLIAIVRGTKSIAANPSYEATVDNTVSLLQDWLGEYEISLGVISDEDVETGTLAGSKMAILPYNPVLSDAELTQLETFVGNGGKLMVFYNSNSRIAALLGIQITGWERHQMRAMHFSDDQIEGLPERVLQASWNIFLTGTIEGKSRIIARWEDSDRVMLPNAAWLASPTGLYMSHILLSDDADKKQQMLLAMVGHYVPEIWPGAAEVAIEKIGHIADFQDYDAAVTGIRAQAHGSPKALGIETSLAAADALRTQASDALTSGNYMHAVELALEARAALKNAFYLCQTSQSPEFRGVWEHSGAGPYPGDWDRSVRVLARNGFTAIMPNMFSGGLAHYNSAILPHSQTFQTYGDQIAQCVEAAHRYGIEVHVWKVNWNLSSAPQDFIDSMRAQGRTQVSVTGEPVDWLCPSRPDNYQLELDTMLEVAQNYDVDGLHFDYIRYPNSDCCYCTGCLERFQAETGHHVDNWPADVYSGPLRDEYREWRCQQISRLVQGVKEAVLAIKPSLKVSAAVFSSYPSCRDTVGQDWVSWIEHGYLDFVCPMDYTEDYETFVNLVDEQMGYVGGRIPLYPGIGAGASNSTLSPDQVIMQILATREARTSGFIIFNYDVGLAETCLPALGMGLTTPLSTPVSLPWYLYE